MSDKPRKPKLTRRVLAGLDDAWNRMDADDFSSELDQTPEERKAHKAAGEWLTKMYEWRRQMGLDRDGA